MRELLDKTLKVTGDEDADGNVLVNAYQDVEPHMEYAAKLRRADAEERGAFGKRKDLHHTMSVPFNIIQTICLQTGLDFFKSEDAKQILKILKRDYPAFKTTMDKRI